MKKLANVVLVGMTSLALRRMSARYPTSSCSCCNGCTYRDSHTRCCANPLSPRLPLNRGRVFPLPRCMSSTPISRYGSSSKTESFFSCRRITSCRLSRIGAHSRRLARCCTG